MAIFTPKDLESLRTQIATFAIAREWEQFHTPRNLLLALMSEVGEAAEIVRWSGDREPAIPDHQRAAWDDEMADILILLIRLADRSGVDLGVAMERKLAKAALKYPVEGFRGSSRKYDQPEP